MGDVFFKNNQFPEHYRAAKGNSIDGQENPPNCLGKLESMF